MSDVMLEQVKELARKLSPQEAAQLRAWLDTEPKPSVAAPKRPMYGLCADLGSGPTDEDIEEIRREMWSNFPREDFD